MKSINDIQDEIIEKYTNLGDWMDVYQELIHLGMSVKNIDTKFKVDSNLIDGCQNKVWISGDINNDVIVYQFDSDSTVIRGIVALIISVLSNRTPQEITESNLYFIEKIGLKDQLTSGRTNGLQFIIDRIYDIAKQYI